MKDLAWTDSGADCACGQEANGAWPLERALAAVSDVAQPVSDSEDVPLSLARGRVLARQVSAAEALPRFDHAAMDGYALRRADLTGAGPWRLPVTQRVAAGQVAAELGAGEAARIFTGAQLPIGADAVVMQEHAVALDRDVWIQRRPEQAENIRRRGEEMRAGAELLPAERCLTARDVAVAASAGLASLPVRRAVRVALLTTGDELCAAGRCPAGAEIPDVNTPMICALLDRPGVALSQRVQVPDTLDAHIRALDLASREADLVITTGGVSVGEEDHVRRAVTALGGRISVPAVAIKPGKPVTFGRLGTACWLGLPGNPMSAFVTFLLFGLPILSRLTGRDLALPRYPGVADAPVARRSPRTEIRPARRIGRTASGHLRLAIGGPVRSGQMSPLAGSDGCVILPADRPEIAAGDFIPFLPFPEGI